MLPGQVMSSPIVHGYAAMARGGPLEPLAYPEPTLGAHDVRVAVSHCGLCFTDIQAIDDFYRITTCGVRCSSATTLPRWGRGSVTAGSPTR